MFSEFRGLYEAGKALYDKKRTKMCISLSELVRSRSFTPLARRLSRSVETNNGTATEEILTQSLSRIVFPEPDHDELAKI